MCAVCGLHDLQSFYEPITLSFTPLVLCLTNMLPFSQMCMRRTGTVLEPIRASLLKQAWNSLLILIVCVLKIISLRTQTQTGKLDERMTDTENWNARHEKRENKKKKQTETCVKYE